MKAKAKLLARDFARFYRIARYAGITRRGSIKYATHLVRVRHYL